MSRLTSASMSLILIAVLSGCAGVQKTDPNYMLYQDAMRNQRPLVSIEWSADGQKMTRLEVNPQVNLQQRQQDAPHPAWTTVNRLIGAAGIVGGIWATGQALEGIVKVGNGATYVDGSYNQPGGHIAGGDVSIPTTTTTETTTEITTETTTANTSETTTNPIAE